MTTTLIKLPGSKWWVELDDTTSEIVATYNKAAIVAEIQALRDTLALYPDPDQEAADYADVLTVLVGRWTVAKNARIVAMLDIMQKSYVTGQQYTVMGLQKARLEELIILKDRLV